MTDGWRVAIPALHSISGSLSASHPVSTSKAATALPFCFGDSCFLNALAMISHREMFTLRHGSGRVTTHWDHGSGVTL